jgi:hypothetical protein
MKQLLTASLFVLIAVPVSAQTAEREVKAVIDQLFDGMLAGDSSMVSAVFAPGARMVSSGNRPDGTPFSQASTTEGFLNAVGTPHDQQWDERTWNLKIDVRQNFASAWMDYAFYLEGEFSHCGINHFQFVKNPRGVWQAVALSDTRERATCDLDPDKVEAAAVEAALRNYLRGHATGDGANFSKVFNPVANLMWLRDGELNTRSSEAYIAGASGHPAENEAERERYIDWVDVTGDAAVGKIVLDYPGAYIVDYMSLLKVDGRWQIVNKIFSVDREGED